MKLNKSSHIYARFLSSMGIARYCIFLLLLVMSQTAFAQAETAPDFMRSTGKIYVVAAVCLIILITLFGYLITLDKKISHLEKRQNNE